MDFDSYDMKSFLRELIDSGTLEGAASGITKQVISKGEESLSENQLFVFQSQVIEKFSNQPCSRCHVEIPWSEKFESIDNGGICSWCSKMESNRD